MIPKVIHYCWFGGNPLPPLAVKCIESWKKFLPDYEIRKWTEAEFDVDASDYTREAYAAGKYAFVSDYARFWILYRHGGIYFDTDVEVIADMSGIISCGPFMGFEKDFGDSSRDMAVAPGLGLGAEPGMEFYREMLELYDSIHFSFGDGEKVPNVVSYTTDMFRKKGLKDNFGREVLRIEGIDLYPSEYFCPLSNDTYRLTITPNTVAIHHFMASWVKKSPVKTARKFIIRLFGKEFYDRLRAFKLKIFPTQWK